MAKNIMENFKIKKSLKQKTIENIKVGGDIEGLEGNDL